MKSHLLKRTLCCLLTMILILGNIPVFSFAEEAQGLCKHHTVHTEQCGYSPAIPGSPCTHVHTEECYRTVTACVHVHGDGCDAENCSHVCSEETGCIKQVMDCPHVHEEACGYVEAVPESPCTFQCADCEKEAADKAAAEAVAALIDALPTVEEVQTMSAEEQAEAYNQVQEAYDAYDALTDDQKALIPDAEEIFTPLFEYFNSLTAPAASHTHAVCGAEGCSHGHSALSWTAWDGTSSLSNGYYYLTSDVSLTSTCYISQSVTLCLYGHTITTNGQAPVFYVQQRGSLTICSCLGPGKVTSIGDGTTNMQVGIQIDDGGSFTLWSGSISGSFAGVYAAQCDVNIYGGTVFSDKGYGVLLYKTNFSMTDGAITGFEEGIADNSPASVVISGGSVSASKTNGYSVSGLGDTDISGGTFFDPILSDNLHLSGMPQMNGVYAPVSLKNKAGTASYSGNGFRLIAQASDMGTAVVTDVPNTAIADKITLDTSLDNAELIAFGSDLILQTVRATGSCGSDLTWTLTDDGVLLISGTGEMTNYTSQTSTPWYSYLSDIQTIMIADGVTSIGNYAFGVAGYPNVSSVTVPQSVTKLGLYAFGGNNIQIHYPGTMEQWLSLSFYFRADTWSAPGAVCSDGTILTLGFCGEYGVSGSPRYVLTSDGCMRIYGTGDMQFYKNLTNRSHWTSYNSSITSVVVEDGVTSIADYSFDGCQNLTQVTLPDNLRSIGYYAFCSCKALKAIDIPSSVTYLGSGVFQSSGLESIEIPEGVKYIKDYSFLNCNALNSVTIPSSVTNIYSQAFYGCSALTDVYYGSDEQAWNQITIASNNDPLLSATIHYTSPCADGHTEETIPGKAATCTESGLTEGTKCSVCGEILVDQEVIPASHKFVDGVCTECGAITGPCGINGDNLIYILTTDGTLTISGTGSMKSYNAYSTAPWYAMQETISSVVLTEGVSSIGEYAFNGCINLTSVTIPDGVNSIGTSAFCDCSSLNSVTIPEEVTYIGSSAFAGCSSLTSINIPEGNIYIRGGTFSDCSSLTSITIPKGVTSIGSSAFSGCSSLTSVTIPEGVNSFGSSAFRDCSSLTSITIPKGVTSIGDATFWGCSSLTSVTIPESVTTIGSHAFRDCKNLKAIAIPEGVTSIGNYAFNGCSSLASIVIPKGVATIEYKTFEGCTSLTSVVIPEGVTTIGYYAFNGCSALTSAVIPEGVTSIEYSAFMGCSSMTSVTIPEGITSIGSNAFSGCSGLTSITIPEGITSIENGTFHGCSGLTSVTIPEGVNSIGSSAFSGCSSLTSVVIPEGVNSIGSSAFSGCSSLTSVVIPKGVTSIGSYAFNSCPSLTTVQFLGDGFTGTNDIFIYRVTAYYPNGNTTWTPEIRDSYSPRVTWKEACIGTLEHTQITDEAKAPTCTETGLTEGSHCSVCDMVLVAQEEIPATGHTLAMVDGTEATCTEDGVKAHYHCSVCGKNFEDANGARELTDVTIPATGHTLDKVVGKAATCTEAGIKAHYHCSVCGNNFEDANGTKELSDVTIPAVGHLWGDWTVTTPATPNADGVETRICSRCQETETRPLPYTGNRLELAGTELENQSVVWIDGAPYPVQKDTSGNPYVILPENSSSILVTYAFNTGSADPHAQYPIGMQVYRIEKTDSDLTVKHLPELDNLLQYSGSSIRITGNKGIRMITSITKSTRNALTGDGLAGFKLLEYGTALCRASALEGGAPMVLGTPGVKSNYAYKEGVADPIFKDTGSLIQYTNVLVGFTDEDCREDIAMRPYIILEDEKGETVTIYGGIVYRSIGYIAYQNRNAFAPGSAAYQYVWNIIHYVYGDQYDADYKG